MNTVIESALRSLSRAGYYAFCHPKLADTVIAYDPEYGHGPGCTLVLTGHKPTPLHVDRVWHFIDARD